ncbi:MAG: hypothetical protein UU67_C0009G0003 [Candidatus Daviesbacteria bacterium GW2011_GWB1_41_5]|uniref:Glycosyltransferase RgtA/B/C/D-like domain-containing protein n=1 Tax=Candidatus Daviesbacteria bacterium GW2011_GWB1_41_5 TaxID=1618429 RepID=A0A0G0WPK1_9BACT|nr:MAG: hypothetical protein UU67_C0009G0003 [Candidatus Daviesbacteria bacterium GW2011_GWB1_41_5]
MLLLPGVWILSRLYQNIRSFGEIITQFSPGDFHPPGYFILLWIWGHLFGFGEINVRLLSVILGFGTICLTYLIGKKLFNNKVAQIGSLFLAVAPLHVYYSQEARMYSLSAFAAVLSFYYFIKVLNKEKWSFLGLGLSTALVLYSDYVTYLVIPSQFVFLLLYERSRIGKWMMAHLISVLLFLPWVLVLPGQIAVGIKASIDLPGWKKVAGGADFKNLALVFIKTILGRISFDNKIIYGLLASGAGVVYGLLLFLGFRKGGNKTKLLLLWIFVPIILAFLISFYIPMLSYFRMIYILPALYLLMAKGCVSLKGLWQRLAIGIILAISSISLFIYYTNPVFQREDWRAVARFLDNISGPKLVLFEDNHVKFPYLYYAKDLKDAHPGLKKVQAREIEDVTDITGKKVYLFDYLVEITDPKRLINQKLKSLGYKQTNLYNFNGVGFIRLYEIQ